MAKRMRFALLILIAAIVVFVVADYPSMKNAVSRSLSTQAVTPARPGAPEQSPEPTLGAYVPASTLPAPKGAFDFEPRMETWGTVLYESFSDANSLFLTGPESYNSIGKIENGKLTVSPSSSGERGLAVSSLAGSVDMSLQSNLSLNNPSDVSEFGFVCRFISPKDYVFVQLTPDGAIRSGYMNDGNPVEVPMMKADHPTLGVDLKKQDGADYHFTCQDKLINLVINDSVSVSFMLPGESMNKVGSVGWFVKSTGPGAVVVGPARIKSPVGLPTSGN
jgi:hypothetical protein